MLGRILGPFPSTTEYVIDHPRLPGARSKDNEGKAARAWRACRAGRQGVNVHEGSPCPKEFLNLLARQNNTHVAKSQDTQTNSERETNSVTLWGEGQFIFQGGLGKVSQSWQHVSWAFSGMKSFASPSQCYTCKRLLVI